MAVVEAVAMVGDIMTIFDRATVVEVVMAGDIMTIVEEEVEVGIMKDEEEEMIIEKEVEVVNTIIILLDEEVGFHTITPLRTIEINSEEVMAEAEAMAMDITTIVEVVEDLIHPIIELEQNLIPIIGDRAVMEFPLAATEELVVVVPDINNSNSNTKDILRGVVEEEE